MSNIFNKKFFLFSFLIILVAFFGLVSVSYAEEDTEGDEDPLVEEQFWKEKEIDYGHSGVSKQTDAFIGVEGANFGTAAPPQYIVFTLIQYFLALLGTAFLAYMIYGGALIMMSSGVEEKIEKGKSIIKNTTIALLIILSSYGMTWVAVWLFTATGSDDYDCVIEPKQSVDHLSGAADYFDGPIDEIVSENCIYK